MKQKYLTSLIVFSLFLIPLVNAQITEQWCDAKNPCSEGLECYSFPSIGLRCAQPNPCSYYECPEGTQCSVLEIYPGGVMCSCVGPECPTTSDNEDTISYDLSTQTVIHVIKTAYVLLIPEPRRGPFLVLALALVL